MNQVEVHRPASVAIVAFRVVAHLEALSWAGLLLGMLLKYVVAPNEHLGENMVAIFGAIHGGLVIAYVGLSAALYGALRWRLTTLAVAVVATIPPFATIVFDRWAEKSGKYRKQASTRGSGGR